MKRQIQYCKAYFTAVKSKVKQDPAFIVNLFNRIKGNLLTNLAIDEIIYLSRFNLGQSLESMFITVPTALMKDGQCIVDDEALKALLVNLFYIEKE